MKQLYGNVHKNAFSSVFVKFAACFLFLGVAYRLLSSSFVQFSPALLSDDVDGGVKTLLSVDNTSSPPLIISDDDDFDTPLMNASNESCNLFIGEWIRDPNGPRYTNNTCYTIEAPQNCMKNGRPDTDYVNWKWNPSDCSLPDFDPEKFLIMMRDKSIAFIGDSIMRNHVQSLLCLLSKVEQAVGTYHDEDYKNRRWSFPAHRVTISLHWAPYLAKAITFEDDNGVSSGLVQLHLDELNPVWTDQYHNFDYVVIAGGKWFLKSAVYYENQTIVGCHNCDNKNNITELGFDYAYRKVLNSTFKFIFESKHKPSIFFRTTTPDHFENGEWNTGGYCNRTGPFKAGEIKISDVDRIMRDVELDEYEKAANLALETGITMKLYDTTMLSLLRPDGHPGVYRQFHPYEGKDQNAKLQNDCLHWCLPGPIDSWNDVLMEMLMTS